MTKFIILNEADIQDLINNKPVEVCIDRISHVLCTDEYYNKFVYESKSESEEE